MLFKRPKNTLEGITKAQIKQNKKKIDADKQADLVKQCKNCKKSIAVEELDANYHLCPFCGHHFPINARQRLNLICDTQSFVQMDEELVSSNVIDFPGYDKKLEEAKEKSGENESVTCGICEIQGSKCAIFVMNYEFMMGSMGAVTGEKITRLFEYAAVNKLPVVGFTVSGGARMQEGILSLMQMAKVSGAVKRHSDEGLLYICVLTDPTTGGVSASFAMQADITLAEPNALVCFAGPRVIEQTIRKKVPPHIQRAENLLERGFIDNIAGRKGQKQYLAKLLAMHTESTGK